MKDCKQGSAKIICTNRSEIGHEMKDCKVTQKDPKPCCLTCMNANTSYKKETKLNSGHWPGNNKCTIYYKMIEKEMKLISMNNNGY